MLGKHERRQEMGQPRGKRIQNGAGGIRQIEPRREEATPDRYILDITTPETLESTVQESQTHVDEEIASSSRQTADPPSPPVARQTKPEMMIN